MKWEQPSLLDFLQAEQAFNQPPGLYCTQCDEWSPNRYQFVTTHPRNQNGECTRPAGKQQISEHKALLTLGRTTQ